MELAQARELAARLLMIDLPAAELGPSTEALLADYPLRAVCLFRRNLDGEAATQQLCARLRERLGAQALLAIDQEGGRSAGPALCRSRRRPWPWARWATKR
ncbi:MAG: hypothetical protein ACK4F7_03960 [Inhella sp.]